MKETSSTQALNDALTSTRSTALSLERQRNEALDGEARAARALVNATAHREHLEALLADAWARETEAHRVWRKRDDEDRAREEERRRKVLPEAVVKTG